MDGRDFFCGPLDYEESCLYDLQSPFTREVAKALLIDSASKWNEKELDMEAKGFGVPPISIRDIVESAMMKLSFFYETAKSYDSLAEKFLYRFITINILI